MRPALLLLLAAASPAWADSHAVIVRNGTGDTIRAIQIGPDGRLGENRMRSQLPPGAEARITYSTGCQASVRLTFASGQTEDHAGLDVCSEPRVVAGQSGTAGPTGAPMPARSSTGPALATAAAAKVNAPAAVPITKTPVPPWTGRSITRRFGGME